MYIITYERNLFLLKLFFHLFLSDSSGQKLFFFCLGKKRASDWVRSSFFGLGVL
ncbi:hypothetical protein FC10_GL001619 [Lactobacillus delbrueckii subsp. lactis DSM 20072]|nr:hypothetical protein HMPREF5505_1519 [Lactobacillus delbrueckii subsp. lactis DSM 20072]KRK64518.1 hypothetical protein FC10_GL001619 [Lactobacillus delbrueckii subsp. lactis DSM 20072]